MGTISDHSPADWDELVAKVRVGSKVSSQSMLSTKWAKTVHNARDFYLQIFDNDNLVMFAKFYYYPEIPETKFSFIKKYIRGSGDLICVNGPLLLNAEANAESVWIYFVKLVGKLAKKVRPSSINIYPSYGFSNTHVSFDIMRKVIGENKFVEKKWATLYINLTEDEDAIWRSLHNSVRTAVRKCLKQECMVVKIQNVDEYKQYYLKNYNGWAAHKYIPSKIKNIWQATPKNTALYVVTNKNMNLVYSGITFSEDNGIVDIGSMFLTPAAKADSVPTQDYLLWEMIKKYKNNGCQYFDFSGINPNPTTEKEKSIEYFKRKFTNKILEYPVFSKNNVSFIFRLYLMIKFKSKI